MDARCWLDEGGRLIDANQTLALMLGYASRGELIAASLKTDLIADPIERAQVRDGCRAIGHINGLEIELTRKDGACIIARLGGRGIHDPAAALEGCELIIQDVTTQHETEEHLRHLASTDPLTGLANYRRLSEVLDGEIRRSARTGRGFALLLFDLNGLKQINDQHGHLSGDGALRRLAGALRLLCRSIDTPARYGGDEFAVVLPEAGTREARAIGRRILEHLARDPQVPRVSASMGVAVHPRDGGTVEGVLLAADRALYVMKRRSPDRARVPQADRMDLPQGAGVMGSRDVSPRPRSRAASSGP